MPPTTESTCSLQPSVNALTLEHVNGNWLADQLAHLKVRYPEVQVTVADTPNAEDSTYRLLTAALADVAIPSREPTERAQRSPESLCSAE
jgi:hypothetical protein